MEERLGKFDMVKSSNNTFRLNDCQLNRLRRFLITEYQVNLEEVCSYGWGIIQIDDNSIIDNDAESLIKAMQILCADNFHVARTDCLLHETIVYGLTLKSEVSEIVDFQDPYMYEMCLSDCLFFTLPLSFIILRPGMVGTTFIAGPPIFLECFT